MRTHLGRHRWRVIGVAAVRTPEGRATFVTAVCTHPECPADLGRQYPGEHSLITAAHVIPTSTWRPL